MIFTDVFSAETGLSVSAITITADLIGISATPTRSSGICPDCGTLSDRVHSHYVRTIADRPWRDRRVILRVTVRRFRCVDPVCHRSIFCERIEYLAPVHARSTGSLIECHRTIGFTAGGEAGSRLSEQLAMPTSPDTILRRIKSTREEPDTQPRFVGVDDWAWKKGHNYGTILIDLERGRVIDILQGRDGSALKAWLQKHLGVQVITRDRWQAFAQAAAEAVPQATQIADRWHLLKNLREAIERFLERRHQSIRETLLPVSSSKPPDNASIVNPGNGSSEAEKPVLSARQIVREVKRRRRTERYEQVRQLHAEGRSIRRIAAELNLSREAAARYVRQPMCPDWGGRKPIPSRLDKFRNQIDHRMASGQTNAAAIYRDLLNEGCPVSYFTVLRYVRRRRKIKGDPASPLTPAAPQTPSSRQLAFAFIRRPECRSDEETSYIQALRGIEDLQKPLNLTDQFAGMIRRNTSNSAHRLADRCGTVGMY